MLSLPLRGIVSLRTDISFFVWGVKNNETMIVEGNKILNTFPPQVSHSKKHNRIPILLTVVTSHTKALPSAGHRDGMLATVIKKEVSNHEPLFFITLLKTSPKDLAFEHW